MSRLYEGLELVKQLFEAPALDMGLQQKYAIFTDRHADLALAVLA